MTISDEGIGFPSLSPEGDEQKLLAESGVSLIHATPGSTSCHVISRNGAGDIFFGGCLQRASRTARRTKAWPEKI